MPTLPAYCPTCGAYFDREGLCLCDIITWRDIELAGASEAVTSDGDDHLYVRIGPDQLERIAVALERISTAIDEIQKKALFK